MALLRILLFIPRLIIFLFLPFFVLVRTAVFFYPIFGWNSWLALACSAGITSLILFFYIGFISRKLSGKKRVKQTQKRRNLKISLVIVVLFCAYGLVYISASKAKTQNVHQEYGSLHPILRLSVSSLALFDPQLVITDMTRTHADYAEMGLKALNNSLHYIQKDGYVHAVDIRTEGRPEWKNSLLKLYFESVGFNTLRHTGSGDHLHISLPIRENPAAI